MDGFHEVADHPWRDSNIVAPGAARLTFSVADHPWRDSNESGEVSWQWAGPYVADHPWRDSNRMSNEESLPRSDTSRRSSLEG